MTERRPDFDELVGADPEPADRERLLRVHELLIAAGPPPELSFHASAPAMKKPTRLFVLRRRVALAALAAVFGLVAFGVGFVVGDRGSDQGTFTVVVMVGTAKAPGASASLRVFDADEAGNWPMKLSVVGLGPSPSDRPYEVWLTSRGRLGALCGSFLAEPDGTTVVPLNAPYKLKDFDGWVVVEEGSRAPLLTT